jgi:ABC-type proline/glycine betaine transport system, permease component
MIGAKGLGGEVWRAIQRLQMGSGFEAGLGIVILAICLDRILQNLVSRIRTKTRV